MDWDWIIEKNRAALKTIFLAIATFAGCDARGQFVFFPLDGARLPDGAPAGRNRLSPEPVPTILRCLHRAVMRQLRPAESAARRLIVMAARDLVVTLASLRPPRAATPLNRKARPHGNAATVAAPVPSRGGAFPLVDPLTRPGPPRPKRARSVPRITFFGDGAPPPAPLRPPCLPGDPLDARRLVRRLVALAGVLDDLPAHALRFARCQARARARLAVSVSGTGGAPRGLGRSLWPFRPGRPPGQISRSSRRDPVHDLLGDVGYFAREALERPNTS